MNALRFFLFCSSFSLVKPGLFLLILIIERIYAINC
ncbi:hypothetical protein CLOBOL_02852 [Enterocloster bolteae ATCC BAA-613]|uniref:Uncharacterized protein n=1 Tax=Enterocloster bolteae (strain ATCC BAA-613 / DSM 15670 / CCUG 46953 / JCM 12243 / WAL 16351) TaxID=411902 RepID=A8RQX1_ENTBW|nr:hypothetical protein CLOBOL_02852 [Enterocloster bolteae ATCC BAA-613]